MTAPDGEREALLARIDQLLAEAYGLPHANESWERRLYIDWELFLLFRRLAATVTEPLPEPDDDPI